MGDWVEAGTVLGYVGDTGNAKGTPTHLHYGIYDVGQARNPYPLSGAPAVSVRTRHLRRAAAALRGMVAAL